MKINPGDAFRIKVMFDSPGQKIVTRDLPKAFFNNRPLYFSPCGEMCFVAVGAVDIETRAGVYDIKIEAEGQTSHLKLAVQDAVFPEITLVLPEEKVFLSPENLERAKNEEEKLNSIWTTVSDKFWEGNFIMPLENSISTSFGTKRVINEKKISVHRGIDITGQEGDEIKAANRGRVVLTEELFFGGNTVIIDHGYGIYTIYMHLSKFNVKVNNIVSKGEVIGFVGSSGRASGPHLHFGVKISNISANPISLLQLKL